MQISETPGALHEDVVNDVALVRGMRKKVRGAAAAEDAGVLDGKWVIGVGAVMEKLV